MGVCKFKKQIIFFLTYEKSRNIIAPKSGKKYIEKEKTMNTNSHIDKLMRIGLTESESRVYFYLLKKKNFTAAEIAKLSQVSRSKIYEVLSKLIQKGLCTETLGKVKKYSSVNPEVGFVNLCNELEDKKKRIADLSEVLLPLYLSEKENTDPLDYIQVLREKSRIVEKIESLEKKTKDEVLTFTKAPYAMSLITSDNEKEFINLKRGIKYKSIYEVDDARKQDFMKMIKIFADAGEIVKITNKLPLKMYIFDEKIVAFTLRDRITAKQSLTAMVIEHPDFAKTLKETFNTYWQKAMTLEEFKNNEKIT